MPCIRARGQRGRRGLRRWLLTLASVHSSLLALLFDLERGREDQRRRPAGGFVEPLHRNDAGDAIAVHATDSEMMLEIRFTIHVRSLRPTRTIAASAMLRN